jgi:hypothetical protein
VGKYIALRIRKQTDLLKNWVPGGKDSWEFAVKAMLSQH